MLTVLSVSEAGKKILDTASTEEVASEDILLTEALGRVLTKSVEAPFDLPPHARSTMDGFALSARDSFGATEGLPALLEVCGEVMMGHVPPKPLVAGSVMRISTGGVLPANSDSVVMVEYTEPLGDNMVAVHRAVAPGENTILPGEDLKTGEVVLPAGHRLRPQDIGALAAMGRVRAAVARRPQVAVLSTGDELVAPDSKPSAGQVRDINSYLLASLVKQCGGEPILCGIVPDRDDALYHALQEAGRYDCVILSGGSSAGTRDLTASTINVLGKPGVIFHGVSMRPGKPLIFGIVNGRPYFGLSGNPTSAMVGFLIFVRPLLNRLQGSVENHLVIRARVDRSLSSSSGREDYFRALLYNKDGQLWAKPLLGHANLISTVIRGNALLRIDQNSEGVETGEMLEVILI